MVGKSIRTLDFSKIITKPLKMDDYTYVREKTLDMFLLAKSLTCQNAPNETVQVYSMTFLAGGHGPGSFSRIHSGLSPPQTVQHDLGVLAQIAKLAKPGAHVTVAQAVARRELHMVTFCVHIRIHRGIFGLTYRVTHHVSDLVWLTLILAVPLSARFFLD